MKKLTGIVLAALLATPAWPTITPVNYQYPINDKYDATVIGTPPEFSPKLPEKIPSKVYTIKSITTLPELFWYDDGLQFSTALQDHNAPLVFNIAGTGAAYNSAKMCRKFCIKPVSTLSIFLRPPIWIFYWLHPLATCLAMHPMTRRIFIA